MESAAAGHMQIIHGQPVGQGLGRSSELGPDHHSSCQKGLYLYLKNIILESIQKQTSSSLKLTSHANELIKETKDSTIDHLAN